MNPTLADLLAKATAAPQQDFEVLITLTNDALPELAGLKSQKLMDNIYSATATGEAILTLNADQNVVAVEPNWEMHAFDDGLQGEAQG